MVNKNKTWIANNLNIVLDITTYCNAKCPQCARTNHLDGGLKKMDWIPLVHWTLEDIKQAFPINELKNIKKMHICPSWGDGIMNPHLYDICEYFLTHMNPKSWISMDTNGSARDEEWWWKFGGLGYIDKSKKFQITFDVDGIDQAMHEKYRRNTNLQKVLDNMKAFSENENVIVKSQSVIFKHNQDYMDDILKLVKSYNSTNHVFIKSRRFYSKDSNPSKEYIPFEFLDENNNKDFLEWSDIEFENSYVVHHQTGEDISDNITCRWAKTNSLQINYDGSVWPCCYLANPGPHTGRRLKEHSLMKEFDIMKLENNIFVTPLSEIIMNKWYQKSLPDSLVSNPTYQCTSNCSTKLLVKEKQQIRTRIDLNKY